MLTELSRGGILRAGEVIELADAADLELAAACALLVKESGGGRNLWGSDAVDPGGAYVKGAEVTRAAYERYRQLRAEGRIGAQGVGPCQLTWAGYQQQADAIGGCWDWRCNVTVGFATLAGLIRAHGIRDGFRRYNGSGPMAERYADDAMTKLASWRARLAAEQEDDDMPLTDQDVERVAATVVDKLLNTWLPREGAPLDSDGTELAGVAVDVKSLLTWSDHMHVWGAWTKGGRGDDLIKSVQRVEAMLAGLPAVLAQHLPETMPGELIEGEPLDYNELARALLRVVATQVQL